MQHIMGKYPLGNGIVVRLAEDHVIVWRNQVFLFHTQIDPREKTPEFRELIVSLIIKYNAQKSNVYTNFKISKQSIDNWINSYEKDGLAGLINSSKSGVGRPKGNKAKIHEQSRKKEKLESEVVMPSLFDVEP